MFWDKLWNGSVDALKEEIKNKTTQIHHLLASEMMRF